ncbi:MAG: type II secretion system protein [Candidatus Rifleibacteriota bacterium]
MMQFGFKNGKKAVTIIEMLVGIFIAGLIGIAIYYMMSQANFVAATASARGLAKQEAEIIIRHLKRDIANSRAKIENSAGSNAYEVVKTLDFADDTLSLEVAQDFPEGEETITMFDDTSVSEDLIYKDVEYVRSGTEFTRKGEKERILSRSVKSFEVSENYDGKIQIDIVIEKSLKGFSGKIEYPQSAIILVKEAENAKTSKNWRQRITPDDY